MDKSNYEQKSDLLTLVSLAYWIVSGYLLLIVIGVPLGFMISLGHLQVENAWEIPVAVVLFFLLRHYKEHLEQQLAVMKE